MTDTLRLSAMPGIGRSDRLDVRPGPGVGQAVGLRAQDDRERPGQVGVGVGRGRVDPGGDDPDAAVAQPGEDVALRRRGERHAKTVPALARMAFGLNRSVRGDAAMTASRPAPSALRRTAPTLPGFSTPSTTTMSGVGRQAPGRSSARAGSGRRRRGPPPGPPKASFAKHGSLT